MSYDDTSPAQGHQALSDVEIIRNNTNELRKFEASAEASPPSNPVAGQFWWTTDTKKLYQRNQANDTWLLLWFENASGYGPAWYYPTATDSSDRNLKTHLEKNITAAIAVHGIKQGSGNNFDADKLDGYEASDFVGASHIQATSGVHGVGAGVIVGTDLTQTLANKTLTSPAITSPTINGGSIGSNISVGGAYVDGRDPSVDGAKLDTYPGSGAPADGTVTTDKIADANVTLAKLKMSQGSWSYDYTGVLTNYISNISIPQYSHIYPIRIQYVAGAAVGTESIYVENYVSSTGYVDTGIVCRIKLTLNNNDGARYIYYVYWDYHAN
ncbi:MAG: hypothetical protein UX37_C0016G0013 [Microgenomates group bacterium GW2011_GWA2_46_16]|nr:MAG: hypothetical protein UX37_C0016G0013 [Microgenomates group bacterium GW2011_GWA2_46_16]